MANDDITLQLEEWKKKYYQSITELEKQQSYDELLQRSLGRLALAAQGLDPALDRQLKSTENNAIDERMPELLSLLDNCLQHATSKSSSGFGFNLFGLGKSADVKEGNEEANILDDDSATDDDISEHNMPIHIVLMQLLERISLPTELSKKATKIRHRIETGIEESQIPSIINEIAEIVSSLGSQAVTEKHEYEEFLKTLTSRLAELDQHIQQTSDEDNKAFKERNVISKAVEDQVSGLRNHVEEAIDLEQLKSSVTGRLDVLNQHFEKYKKSDHDRFDQSQRQIKALNKRLQEMEEESSELRKSAEKSRELALKDALTGIWNRQALNEDLEKEFVRWQRYQKPLSIVVWDIDFFKRVNDDYGHAAGDKVLKTIARIFMQATRDADFIARFGGEEFVGIFPETRLEDALSLANKIREKIETSKFHYENKPVPITASAGLATFRPNDTIDDVFKRADAALYRAKEAGRNRCIADG